MARTVLTVQEINRTGLDPAYVSGDATNDHSFDNVSQAVFVHIKNSAAQAVATFLTPMTVDGLPVGDLAITVPATTGERLVGPFRNDVYGQADALNNIDKAVLIDLDIDTGITLAAFELGDVNI